MGDIVKLFIPACLLFELYSWLGVEEGELYKLLLWLDGCLYLLLSIWFMELMPTL